MAIGIFDSGIGGLSVYKKLKEKYPNTKFIYFADLANFPYGEKEDEDILGFSLNIVNFLVKENITSLVIACNTASAVSINYLKSKFSFPIVGMIDPICNSLKAEKPNSLSIIATRKTIASKEYENRLKERIKYSVGAPKLVEAAEKINKLGIEDIIKEYISPDMVNSTKVVLACTHFPLLKKYILKVYNDIKLLDPSDYILDDIKIDDDKGTDIFYTSSNLEYFRIQLTNILGRDNLDVRVHKWNTKH